MAAAKGRDGVPTDKGRGAVNPVWRVRVAHRSIFPNFQHWPHRREHRDTVPQLAPANCPSLYAPTQCISAHTSCGHRRNRRRTWSIARDWVVVDEGLVPRGLRSTRSIPFTRSRCHKQSELWVFFSQAVIASFMVPGILTLSFPILADKASLLKGMAPHLRLDAAPDPQHGQVPAGSRDPSVPRPARLTHRHAPHGQAQADLGPVD